RDSLLTQIYQTSIEIRISADRIHARGSAFPVSTAYQYITTLFSAFVTAFTTTEKNNVPSRHRRPKWLFADFLCRRQAEDKSVCSGILCCVTSPSLDDHRHLSHQAMQHHQHYRHVHIGRDTSPFVTHLLLRQPLGLETPPQRALLCRQAVIERDEDIDRKRRPSAHRIFQADEFLSFRPLGCSDGSGKTCLLREVKGQGLTVFINRTCRFRPGDQFLGSFASRRIRGA
ncbi:hypothetical protein BaRGS_00000179, partial [Batillaria attramentaria]